MNHEEVIEIGLDGKNEEDDDHNNNVKMMIDGDDDDDDVESCLIPTSSNTSSSSIDRKQYKLPEYLIDAFNELYTEDGLLVLGKGLGTLSLLACFVRYYSSSSSSAATATSSSTGGCSSSSPSSNTATTRNNNKDLTSPPKKEKQTVTNNINPKKNKEQRRRRPLIFILGLHDDNERNTLIKILQLWNTPYDELPIGITNESGLSSDRQKKYEMGGVYMITSRILIVDLLTGIANSSNIDGLLIMNAHNVTEQSTDAFIIRIFKTQKQLSFLNKKKQQQDGNDDDTNDRHGFIKAITDSPESLIMTGEFNKVNKVLKSLHVRRLYLYPRFHDTIKDDLEEYPPNVDEIHQELSSKQKDIQHYITICVSTCIRELKKLTSNIIEWNTLSGGGGGGGSSSGNSNGKSNNKTNAVARNSANSSIGVDNNELSIENCITTNFDLIITKQLSNEWYKLKPNVKQLVQDLRTLRTLFYSLIQYDCISFYKLINSIKTISASSRYPSMWLLTPAANLLFKTAKERIFTVIHPPNFNSNSSSRRNNLNNNNNSTVRNTRKVVSRLKPILEINPKWKLLKQILLEIKGNENKKGRNQRNTNSKDNGSGDSSNNNSSNNNNGTILIMVKDSRTLDTVRSYLTEGKDNTMTIRWLRYLEQYNDKSRSVTKTAGGVSAISEETRLLLEEEGRARNFLFGKNRRHNIVTANNSDDKGVNKNEGQKRNRSLLNQVPSYVKKRRRIAMEKGRGTGQSIDDIERSGVLDDAIHETEEYDDSPTKPATKKDNYKVEVMSVRRLDEEIVDDTRPGVGNANVKNSSDKNNNTSSLEEDDDDNDNDEEDIDDDDDDDDEYDHRYKVSTINQLKVIIRSYSTLDAGDDGTLLLHDIDPSYIILYDAEVSFIRAIEVHSSTTRKIIGAKTTRHSSDLTATEQQEDNKTNTGICSDRMHVYFILFEASAEEKNFMKSLEREQNAFERLITHKKTMPLPNYTTSGGGMMTQEMQQAMMHGGVAGTYAGGTLPLSADTRTGRGKARANSKERRDIAVDVREFRSALPSILHQGGMRLAPVTLIVGDFVLSTVHCVERKSISDLFGSFNSGRLYTQAEAMCKHYKCPCLLIEFDPNKSFSLINSNELGVEIRTDSICSKMVLLSMHFPKLRILWSRGPHETLRIFKELKASHDEVDVEKAMEIGRQDESIESLFGDYNQDKNNNGKDGEDDEDEINEAAKEMLLRLPGVNIHSARKIMKECDTIAELADMDRDKLRKIAGPVTGQKLFTFFRQKMAAT